jgi:hypothetical protein
MLKMIYVDSPSAETRIMTPGRSGFTALHRRWLLFDGTHGI